MTSDPSGAGELDFERRYLAFDLHVVRQVAGGAPVPVAGVGAIAFHQVHDAVRPARESWEESFCTMV